MDTLHLPYVAAALGAGLAVVGGGLGIGKLAAAAMDGIARQPQAGGAIGTNMLIAAGLIEGATLLAEVVAILIVFLK
ncbi:MAG TPA: ATP synthase F0 subunit C [Verrucomicrobiae bacterium]|nr:ATP synthase F0 subunit C [Acidobacteriota bacterium]HZE89161.1 ATP synthase F0 subunit C [Verrucomicrobiae bacterium]